ncbi:hypothetical protein [Saccharibacillus deserti]|uniref:hypothetical protein n=1 Tax=Saccharibacillus deserti TaxID=1634444 RepID=UPI001553B241|nr:hypothetical protein [Saccharibacillus deserti]
MTLVLAMSYDEGVIVAADTLRTIYDENNKRLEGSKEEFKIKILHNRIGIAVAGLGQLSDACVSAVQSICRSRTEISFEEIEKICMDYFKFSVEKFNEHNNKHVMGMHVLLFGISDKGKKFIKHYSFEKDNVAIYPVNIQQPYAIGSGVSVLNIMENPIQINETNPDVILNHFLKLITQVSKEEETVGGDIQSVLINQEEFVNLVYDGKEAKTTIFKWKK